MVEAIFSADHLTEDIDVEAKRAGGRDGKGALPNDVWETYSAFANTDGGVILLGVAENEGVFRATGIEEPERVLRDFWNQINNPQKVSRNLLTNSSVRCLPAGNGRWVLEIQVPRAARQERPVFINGNPLTGTFKRLRAGDYRCRENEVRRMLAEQTQDARDARILENFGVDDLDMDSLRAYRNRLADFKPDHPFRDSETRELLRLIGGWAHDRQSNREGRQLRTFGRQLPSFGRQVPSFEGQLHSFGGDRPMR